MDFWRILVDDNSENNENNDIEDNIAENATSNVEGDIRPYMFEPMSMNDRSNSDNNEQVENHEAQGVQMNSIQATEL